MFDTTSGEITSIESRVVKNVCYALIASRIMKYPNAICTVMAYLSLYLLERRSVLWLIPHYIHILTGFGYFEYFPVVTMACRWYLIYIDYTYLYHEFLLFISSFVLGHMSGDLASYILALRDVIIFIHKSTDLIDEYENCSLVKNELIRYMDKDVASVVSSFFPS